MADRARHDNRAEEARKIAEKIAGRAPSCGEVAIVDTAIKYLSQLVENERSWPTRTEQRAKLSRVAELAAELSALLEKPLSSITSREREIEPAVNATQRALPEIAREFTAAANAIPKGRGRAGHVPNPDGDNAVQATARKVVEIFSAIHARRPSPHSTATYDMCVLLLAAAGADTRAGWGDEASGWRPHIERALARVTDADIATIRARLQTIDLLNR